MLELLDQAELLQRLIPEWEHVRFKIQHNPVHRYTVDRHLLETAAQAAALTRQVDRPDLLLMGALLHDIGKGYPGDHSIVGAPIAERIAARMGFSYGDAATIEAMTLHHLLLPDTATRRDLDDPMTITSVAEAVGSSAELLELLHALTIADAAATGPGAWSDWKAGLIASLVRRTRARSCAVAGCPRPRRSTSGGGRWPRPARWRSSSTTTRCSWPPRTGAACCRRRPACWPCTRSTSGPRASERTPAWR